MNNQKGFGAIEALLILIIIGIIGGTGFYVYKASNKDANITDSQIQQKNEEGAQEQEEVKKAPEQKYLEVAEWNIKIPLDQKTTNLYYENPFEQNGNVTLAFRSKALDNITKDCKASSVLIERGRASDNYIGDTGPAGTFQETYNAMKAENNPRFHKKLGEYYYVAGHPGGSCTSTPQNPKAEKETQVLSDIRSALNNMVEI